METTGPPTHVSIGGGIWQGLELQNSPLGFMGQPLQLKLSISYHVVHIVCLQGQFLISFYELYSKYIILCSCARIINWYVVIATKSICCLHCMCYYIYMYMCTCDIVNVSFTDYLQTFCNWLHISISLSLLNLQISLLALTSLASFTI